MSILDRLFCALRGGHRWETVEDEAGGYTRCARCGATKRSGTAGNPPRGPYTPPEGG